MVVSMLAKRMSQVGTDQSPACRECRGGLFFDVENGEQVCGNCGMVSEPTYTPYLPSNSTYPLRTEEPESNMIYDLHLHTLVGRDDYDANGKRIKSNYEFEQLRRLNNNTISRDSTISNEMKAVAEIRRITETLNLSKTVATEAQEVYHRGLKDGVVRRKSIANMSAAAVLIAAKTVGVSCSSEEIERNITDVNGKTTRRYYRLLIRQMNLNVGSSNPSLYVSGIAGRAGLSVKVERKALEILAQVGDNPLLGDKRSQSLAAAALYLAATKVGEHTNQLRVAFAANITPITIRKRSAEISRILDESTKQAPGTDAELQVGPDTLMDLLA
jgi:transcription initiation factor TFIIB